MNSDMCLSPQVTGTGGGTSIKHNDHIYIAPSGVQKERLEPQHMFVMDFETKRYLRKPTVKLLGPSGSSLSVLD